MKLLWGVVSIALLVPAVVDTTTARERMKPRARCIDRAYSFSWGFLLPGHPEPQPNGCAPPVHAYGKYVGQDPDPNIRLQLLRDPATGYSAHQN